LTKRSKSGIELVLCGGLFALLCARTLAYQYTHIHQIAFADDAFYYFVVAQHIVRDGRSTFDGFTLTNGYHPLWMALLALQYKTLGQSLLVTRCMEFVLGGAALLLTLLFVRLPNALLSILFTLGFYAVLNRVSLNGMETALFVCCFSLFLYVSASHLAENRVSGLIEGLLAGAVIASRIDAVVFVLPLMLLVAKSWTRRIVALITVLLCGAVYASVDRYYFGIALPISGEIKSLGGLQINRILFHFLQHLYDPIVQFCYATVVLFVISLLFLRKPRPYTYRPLLLAFVLGYAVYMLRLAFLSSWVIWKWYDYPFLIGYIACAPSLLVMCSGYFQRPRVYRQLLPAAAVVTLVLVLVVVGVPRSHGHLQSARLEEVPPADGDVSNAVLTTLDGARVAMGDRAGSFAYHYPGSVNQLEGLMNDAQYLRTLRSKADVRQLLCERDIRFVVAYEPDLSAYATHLVHTIRPELSQYPAPGIQVFESDQVARIAAVSPGETRMEYLYIWKLRCGPDERPYQELGSNHPPEAQ
jgi:hypothetical protein